ncbi:Hypp995 [Branchiostoma lanceolatum]|uniref:Hypp995 protein n=1 Tax=Branchiostoma lanceolatum TaxID=7740 RepID=A0A8K0EIV8_BRALA|nr:Hypp995 [Branchiostoma lanceolatum]
MDDSPRPTGSSSTAREEERLEKVLREGTFRDSLVLAKVIDTHPSSDSDSDESTPISSRARRDVGSTNRPQCQPKDNSDKLQQRSAEEPSFLGSGDASGEDKLKTSQKSEGDATARDRCTEDTVRQDKQNRDPNAESEASASGEAVKKVSQDTKTEKAGGSKEGSSPSSGESESVGSSSESGSDSDQNRSNDGANSASTDDRNQVFITIETPLFIRSHYVYLPKKKKTEDGDKDDSGDGPSSSSPDDPSVGKKEEAAPSKRKHSSDSESEQEGKTPGPNKRQKTESEDTQRDSSVVSQDLVRDSAKEENIDDKEGRSTSETKTGDEKEVINRPSGEIVMEKQKEKESSKAASLKRPLEEDDSRQESPKRRRESSGPDAGPTEQDDAACKESETQVSDRTEKTLSGEGDEARPTPQDEGNTGDHVSPSPRRRRSFTERYYEDAPILPAPPVPVPPAATPTTETGDSAAGASKTESAAPTSDAATSTTTTSTNGTSEKKTPSPLGPPWNMYDPRNPESSSIRGTKKERYNLRIAQAMVDNAINTVLQELGFSPGSSRRKRRRRRERERQQAMEEAGVSSAIRSQGLSMGGHHGGRTTTTSPGCPHHRRTSELNAGAGPSSASLPVPENEDEFERLAVSEAIGQAGLSKSEEPKDGSKDKDSSA